MPALLLALLLALAGCAAPPREASVRPGVNRDYAGDFDFESQRRRLEGESREIYRERAAIVAAIGARPGEALADIGAGTGVFTELFAREVGAAGLVFAIDISPKFIAYIAERAAEQNLSCVRPQLCREDSIGLPERSIDIAFLCDTYHHLEFPRSTLRSIRDALRPGGRLYVLDFERIPGVSPQWVLDHVRAGREEVIAEIEREGYDLAATLDLAGLRENYFLRFEPDRASGDPARSKTQ